MSLDGGMDSAGGIGPAVGFAREFFDVGKGNVSVM